MDNLCHTLVGAALGEAGLKRRTRFGNATLMIASNIPDIDVAVFATSVPSVSFRRGWTHGPLADVILPVAVTAVMMAVARVRPSRSGDPPLRPASLLLLSYIGVLLHIALDSLNPYGLRVLAPFSWRWFYIDALFIVDPWLWLVLGAGVWWARTRRSPAPARGALLLSAVYIAAMIVSVRMARGIVIERWEATHGQPPAALMVGPVPVTPFRREVIVDAGDHYETGTFRWLPLRVEIAPQMVPKNNDDPRTVRARDDPTIRGFLVWSRFPFWTFEPAAGGTLVSVSDMRFPSQFAASVLLLNAR